MTSSDSRANELDTKAPYEATFVLVHPYSTRMRTTMTAMTRAAMAMFLVLMMGDLLRWVAQSYDAVAVHAAKDRHGAGLAMPPGPELGPASHRQRGPAGNRCGLNGWLQQPR